VSLPLVPLPARIELRTGAFALGVEATLSTDTSLHGAAAAARLLLGPATGCAFPRAESGADADVRVNRDGGLGPEAYRLSVSEGGVDIAAATDAGVFYALQTLRQLLPQAIYSPQRVDAHWTLPAVRIEDTPRFAWRGLHLDVGRHFMPVAFIKKYIDLLALHKMNTFHWHLTEDQGWRIEIKRYPKLTEIGAWRARTATGNMLQMRGDDLQYDNTPHGGFYTQDEVRDVVAYAAARHVNVVPEIEFPGHAQAAIAAYPELGNSGELLAVMEKWGISENTFKPSEETVQFFRNVLDEVMALFPSEYIHIGGDEVRKKQWENSRYAQQRMRELGLANTNELQNWLFRQMDQHLSANGRQLVGWDEIAQGGLSPGATVMSWRGVKPGLQAAGAGHDVVMAPTFWTYFDYYQADRRGEPPAIGFYLPLSKVYGFDPAPGHLPASVRARILGAQGQLWTEYMKTPDHVEYMAYPRAAALAEVLWSPAAARDYADFRQRLDGHLKRLDVLRVNYRPPGNDTLTLRGRIEQWLWTAGMRLYFWFSRLRSTVSVPHENG